MEDVTPKSELETPVSSPSEPPVKKRCWGMAFYYLCLTCVPVLFIMLLPNNWGWIIVKILAGLFYVSISMNLVMSPATLRFIGDAGAGFIMISFALGALCYWPIVWLWALLAFFMITAFIFCERRIREAQQG